MATEMWALSFWIAYTIKWFKLLFKRRSGANPPKQSSDEGRQPKCDKASGARTFNPVEAKERLARTPALSI